MKRLFYIGLIALAIFEITNVYFIMPMPGSQKNDTIDLAYFLYSYRWIFRSVAAIMIVAGSMQAFGTNRLWVPIMGTIIVVAVGFVFNFEMTADHMFIQPHTLAFDTREESKLVDSSLVIAVHADTEAKAYPIRYILYHHQVRDSIGGKPIMVTYCNVCRTGRVYEPTVNGQPETFRLVGMDHFNAMFEDATTKSWWRQANGEAITGAHKGNMLPEVESSQLTLGKFFSLYPYGKVMRADSDFHYSYDTLGRFEKGKTKGDLTRRDSLAWKNKSWVLGVQVGQDARAYDWNHLVEVKIIQDKIGATPIIIALSADGQTFGAFENPSASAKYAVQNDSIVGDGVHYDFAGRSPTGKQLRRLKAYQEFWHSWKQFHPNTTAQQ